MKKKITITVFAIVLSLFFAAGTHAADITADDLIYYTEAYPPHNFEKDGQVTGVSVEILQLMWKELGSSKTNKDIKIVPWARGYNDVLNKNNVVLFGMGYSADRAKVLQWVGAYFEHSLTLIAKKGKNIKISSLDDAKKYKVGVIREDIGHQIIVKKGFDKDALDYSTNASSLFKKLNAGRIDMICYMEDVAEKKMKLEGLNVNDYENVFEILNLRSGYGFNKNIPKKLIQQFQAALDKLIANGEINKILVKYDLD